MWCILALPVGVGENWKWAVFQSLRDWRQRCPFRFHHARAHPHPEPLLLIPRVPGEPPVLRRSFSSLVILLEYQAVLASTSFHFHYRHSRRFRGGLARDMEFKSIIVS